MRWGALFSLDSVMNARLHEFAMLFCSIWRPGRAVEGGKRYQMAACTSARRRMDTGDLSEAANYRDSALVVVHGVRNFNFPFLMPVTASKAQSANFTIPRCPRSLNTINTLP